MKKTVSRAFAVLIAALLLAGPVFPAAQASEVTDDAVAAVTAQLEAIDSLQEMWNKRSEYKVSNKYCDAGTTDPAIIAEHEAVQAGYETYVNEMTAARLAAQQAYDALTDAQKAQIDPALSAKLSSDLATVFKGGTYSVTPRSDEYTFEAVKGGKGFVYETSNQMVSGNIVYTFVLVDTSDGETSWTPNGKYAYGKSNYEVAYCCDVQTPLKYGVDYKRINLEDSKYYGANAAQHIRAILQNSYPFLTMDEMKASLVAGGLSETFVNTLTRSDIISAVQMAVWTYANATDGAEDGLGYFASIDITKNIGSRFTPLHDHNHEYWDWLPGKEQRTYDARAAYRVNTLAYYLCNLEGIAPQDDQIVISDVKVTRADLVPGTDDTYSVGMYIHLNSGGNEQDHLKVTVTSYHTNEDGSVSLTAQNAQRVGGRSQVEMSVKATSGDTLKVVVDGKQKLAKGVYFYEPEGGRDVSQCLVGVAEGETNIKAEETFEFVENVGEAGLRIYKTEAGTGLPLSEITFNAYRVVPEEGEALNETPTDAEIAKYATEANRAASLTTDPTGYAATTLENGTYLIVEEHNTAKIKAPVSPFYITVPMTETKTNEDGTTSAETVSVISVYPKNELVAPPEEPPVLPPVPDNVSGRITILKHAADDTSHVLEGAEFQVYRPATSEDTAPTIIRCGGVEYAVMPVNVDGKDLILTTGEDGIATSPDLPCGVYFLVETKAPAGYHSLEEAVSVTVVSDATANAKTVYIPNQPGSLLPETGGPGTTLLLSIGSLLTLAAVVLLITKRRMSVIEKPEN